MTTLDWPDYNRPTRIGDDPFLAVRQTLTSGAEIFPFFNPPATRWSSYHLRLTFTNGAATATNFASVEIRGYDYLSLPMLIWRDTVEVNAGGVDTYVTDRLHGAFVSLFPTFPGGVLDCDWVLNNRPATSLRILEYPAAADRILLCRDTAAVGPGATSGHRFAPSFTGPGIMSLDAPGAGTWTFYAGSLVNPLFSVPVPATTVQSVTLQLPARPLHFTITNPGAGAVTYHTSIWAADP